MKNVKIILLILAVSLSIIGSFAFAQVGNDTEKKIVKTLPPPPEEDCPSEAACELWGEFKEKYGGRWSVEWQGDKAKEIYGRYNLGKGEITTEEEAYQTAMDFLSENTALFKLDTSDLKKNRIKLNMMGRWLVDYTQYYEDIPVYGGNVRVILNNKSELTDVLNNFYPRIDVSITPVIMKEEAVIIGENEVTNRAAESVELYILPQNIDGNLKYFLTWRVYVKGAYLFVDAVNGEIIYKEYTVTAAPAPARGSNNLPPATTSSKGLIGLTIVAISVLFIWMWKRK